MSISAQKAIIYTSKKHSLYLGRLERVLNRVNVPSTLLVSLEDELEIVDPLNRPVIRSKSLLIPAGSRVIIDTRGAHVAMCFLDDLGTEFASLLPCMQNTVRLAGNSSKLHVHSHIANEADIIAKARYLSAEKPATEDAFELFETWFSSARAIKKPVSDERIATAISLIKNNCHTNMSVADIARQVNLSVPRLIQLFKQLTGTPIRRFRLWQRIFVTASKLTEGHSLTDAAILAGFADYAHFSRVYRELGGASPGAARNNTEIRLLAG